MVSKPYLVELELMVDKYGLARVMHGINANRAKSLVSRVFQRQEHQRAITLDIESQALANWTILRAWSFDLRLTFES